MRINLVALTIGLSVLAAPSLAEEEAAPLSAIDWLSDVIRQPEVDVVLRRESSDVAKSATPAAVTTSQLGQIKLDAVGLLPSSMTGLPQDFWGSSSSATLQKLINAQRTELPPPLAELLSVILLAELTPPADSKDGAGLFLARIDKFLDIGALDQARALMEQAGPNTPRLFRRWFDVSLLTGHEDQACRVMKANPDIAPTYPARIFCMARGGDWNAAVLTLNSARLLDVVTEQEEALLARFLDPDLFEGEPPLPLPERLSPLAFRMHEAIGEPLPQSTLPNAFAYAALSKTEGWKARITAAERLTRSGAIPASSLMAIYQERSPAASGGVWDRVSAVQGFDAALLGHDSAALGIQLSKAIRAMRRAGLEHVLADFYGERLARTQLSGKAAKDVARLALMSPSYEAFANSAPLPDGMPTLLGPVAKGLMQGATSNDAVEASIIAAFSSTQPPENFGALLDDGRLGEAALEALLLMSDGPNADPASIEHGLSLLRVLGLEDTARRTALHILLNRTRR